MKNLSAPCGREPYCFYSIAHFAELFNRLKAFCVGGKGCRRFEGEIFPVFCGNGGKKFLQKPNNFAFPLAAGAKRCYTEKRIRGTPYPRAGILRRPRTAENF